MRTALLCLALVGCGFGTGPYNCDVQGLGAVSSDVPWSVESCRRMQVNTDTAFRYARDLGVDPAMFAGVSVRVRNLATWHSLGEEVVGEYLPPANVEIARDGRPLLHELFHHVDCSRLPFSCALSFTHYGWGERGWTKADSEYSYNDVWALDLAVPGEKI